MEDDNYNFKERKTTVVNTHNDYASNVNWGAKFVQNCTNGFDGKEFTIRLEKSLDGEKYYFLLSFSVQGQFSDHPNYGKPVDPNQTREKFMQEFKAVYFAYSTMQRKWNERQKNKEAFSAFGKF
jgi:hypothetical protein